MKLWLTNQLLLFFLAAVAGQDGSTPEEICPCQTEDSCQDDRHIFGRDAQDIKKFGLIPPCRNFGEIPCCPRDPPPPKDTKLTQQDLQGFSPAELAELGIMPEGTIGSSSLPLAEQTDQSKIIQHNQQPIDITQPGAASLAPHGATVFTSNVPKGHPNQQKSPYPVQQPNSTPKMQYRPVYQAPPPVYQKPVYPTYYTPPRYYPPPQMYRPVYSYSPMYRPAYQKH